MPLFNQLEIYFYPHWMKFVSRLCGPLQSHFICPWNIQKQLIFYVYQIKCLTILEVLNWGKVNFRLLLKNHDWWGVEMLTWFTCFQLTIYTFYAFSIKVWPKVTTWDPDLSTSSLTFWLFFYIQLLLEIHNWWLVANSWNINMI